MRSSIIAGSALILFALVSTGCWLETGRGPGDQLNDNPPPTTGSPAPAPVPYGHPAQTAPINAP